MVRLPRFKKRSLRSRPMMLLKHHVVAGRESGCRDDGDARILSYFLPELLRPAVGMATFYYVTLWLLQHQLLPLQDRF